MENKNRFQNILPEYDTLVSVVDKILGNYLRTGENKEGAKKMTLLLHSISEGEQKKDSGMRYYLARESELDFDSYLCVYFGDALSYDSFAAEREIKNLKTKLGGKRKCI